VIPAILTRRAFAATKQISQGSSAAMPIFARQTSASSTGLLSILARLSLVRVSVSGAFR